MIIRHFGRQSIRKTVLSTLLVTVMAGAVFAPAFAQSGGGDTQARLTRIENEIQTLSRAIFKGETPPPGAFGASADQTAQAELQLRLTQMEEDLRVLTGKVEEQNYQMERLRDEVTQLKNASLSAPVAPTPAPRNGMIGYPEQQTTTPASDMDGVVDVPAQNNNFSVTDPNAPAPVNAPTSGQLGSAVTAPTGQAVTAGTPAALYEESFASVRSRDFAKARAGFEKFLSENPDHNLAANATYWLGETYYAQNDYESAARIFAEGFQKFPKGAKGPDNLLKLGLSLAGLGKTKEACIALGQLRKQYPSGAVPVLTQGDQEMAKLQCNP